MFIESVCHLEFFLAYDMTPPGYAILGDSAFPRVCSGLTGKIVRGRKSNELSSTRSCSTSTYLVVVEKILDRAMPSER